MNVRIEFPPALMTREVAAYYIGGSLTDIDVLKRKGELIAVGDGKRVRFRKTDLDRYVESVKERRTS
jgi:excisionase family DNA binding protein